MSFFLITAKALAEQVLVILLLMLLGIYIRKKGMVSLEAARMFCNVVLVVIIPALLVHTFEAQAHDASLAHILLGLGLAVFFHLLAILVTKRLYAAQDNKTVTERLFVICSNCGFMGIPLLMAAVGEQALIYAALYIAVFNIYNWSHAAMMLQRSRSFELRKVLLTPGTLGALVGLAVYALHLRFPYALSEALSMVSSMNTPLPTMIMGMFVATIDWKAAFADLRVWKTVLLRLVGMPLLFVAIVWAAQVHRWFPGSNVVAFILTICGGCSGAISTILLPARFGGGDEAYGGTLVAVSNVVAIAAIPLMASVAMLVFQVHT